MLSFRSKTEYVWSGVGQLVWNGNTFTGAGSYGKMGAVTEGIEVKADGTTVTLSGIDPDLLGECLTDIQVGLPAKIWYGHFSQGAVVGNPFLLFSGQIDKPSFKIAADEVAITLSLENKMINHSRANMVRYTSASQRLKYPADSGFDYVEMLSDIALRWGS